MSSELAPIAKRQGCDISFLGPMALFGVGAGAVNAYLPSYMWLAPDWVTCRAYGYLNALKNLCEQQ